MLKRSGNDDSVNVLQHYAIQCFSLVILMPDVPMYKHKRVLREHRGKNMNFLNFDHKQLFCAFCIQSVNSAMRQLSGLDIHYAWFISLL